MDIYLNPPQLKNTFANDNVLQESLRALLPGEIQKEIFEHLIECGELAVKSWLELSRQAEMNPPEIVDGDVQTSEAWRKLHAEAATHGIVATGFERKFDEYSRLYQMALLYLFHSSSAFVSCPLAMTDGAARAIELYGDSELKSKAFKNLTSRDPKIFWTSGQWMTERSGGSDVSGTSTIASRTPEGWKLTGTKWFTSATTSQMSMLLARPEGAPEGSKGLSLFYCELRDPKQKLQNIKLIRLKPKLGTHALPTAELELNGTMAKLVGGEGSGVRKISSLFNITRIYNSVCATSHMRRALDLAWDFSRKRKAFGKILVEHALHRATLDQLEAQFRTCLRLTFFVAALLGKEESGVATENEKILLRSLTPVAKLYTAKTCMQVVSEVVELFGGAGYIEDTGIPRLLRDAQVFSIWEGTTNVLSLDFLRAVEKESAAEVLIETLNAKAPRQPASLALTESLTHLTQLAKENSERSRSEAEILSRNVAFNLAYVFGN